MVAYNRCLQISFIIIQFVFIGLGLALIGLGAWLEVEEGTLVDAVNQQAFLVGPYLLIVVGIAIVAIAVVGVLGAMCDHLFNRVLLYIYIIVVFIIFVVEIVGAVLAFVYRDQAVGFIESGLTSTLTQYNGTTPTAMGIREAWDFVQTTLNCCGVNNVTDWLNADLEIPTSCCNVNMTCITEQYSKGCSSAVLNLVQTQLVAVAAVGIAFLVGEIVVILLAFCLVCCTDFDKE
ncbi:tetraspanin-7-like [Halichondria panicea]|uniref:tetraspanin-7-like n=1 Tax=Halichondria panicea TaxID=6063 RepID=UPI00312B7EEE